MRFHGIWDLDELYDLASDPAENNNLIAQPGHEELAGRLSAKLFSILETTGGMQIPMSEDAGRTFALRSPAGSEEAPFPPAILRPPT
jgi:N-acetylglucosamine-6-sulfatase